NKKIANSLKEKNQLIEESLLQKELFLKETHHRVKNNLQIVSSLMSIQGRSLSDQRSKDLIRESQNRIKSMSLVHESLYQAKDLSQIEIESFIKRIAEGVNSSLKAKNQDIELKILADNFKLNAEQAVPIGIIINELASNAYKHAFKNKVKGRLLIEFIKSDDGLTLKVDDDGEGLPNDFKADFSSGSIGMALVQALAQDQLDGDLLINSNNCKFSINFKPSMAA
ncbi:MAG: sensor histidine kinase, partial [Bacteroidia bacterium]